jgi:SAM-dependent methyltransferase
VVDAIFGDPRLTRVYDQLDPDRSDLDVYLALADELGARSVLDIGCGTGTLACMLAARGLDVTGLDPAGAMLDVARSKPGADAVRWIHGDVSALALASPCRRRRDRRGCRATPPSSPATPPRSSSPTLRGPRF